MFVNLFKILINQFNRIMKRLKSFYSIAIILAGSLFSFFSCYAYPEGDRAPSVEKSFKQQSPGSLEVKTSGGGITVEGTQGNQVIVKAYVKKNGKLISSDDPFMQELYEGYDILIEQHQDHVVAIAKQLKNSFPWKTISVSFFVEVPVKTACDLNTSGGGISISKVEGMQKINTSGGGINIADISGNVRAHTSGGGIHVRSIEGKADVNTSGGGITITNANGDITANTSGGGIRLEDIYGKVNAHTSGGSININGVANYVKATTSGGRIDVDVTGLSEELYLETSGGGIRATLPRNLGMDLNLSANKVNAELINFSGYNKNGRLEGTMNDGGIPIYMHTSGGNINVDFYE